jgi:hypothetical protein
VARYVQEVRPQFALTLDQRAVFVTDYGEPLENNRLSDTVKLHMRYAGFASQVQHTGQALGRMGITVMVENMGQMVVRRLTTTTAILAIMAGSAITYMIGEMARGAMIQGRIVLCRVHQERNLQKSANPRKNEGLKYAVGYIA